MLVKDKMPNAKVTLETKLLLINVIFNVMKNFLRIFMSIPKIKIQKKISALKSIYVFRI